MKHTTVLENCDGKRKEWWARNQLTSDYELLCRDGTRAPARNYKDCYLGKVNSNAIVTNPRIGEVKLNAFINLFKYAQQYYGQKVHDEFTFSMFYSQPPYADLIFQDATQQVWSPLVFNLLFHKIIWAEQTMPRKGVTEGKGKERNSGGWKSWSIYTALLRNCSGDHTHDLNSWWLFRSRTDATTGTLTESSKRPTLPSSAGPDRG